MEEFDDDDEFDDLYADVEVQASSAINAMHGLPEMAPGGVGIFGNAVRGFSQLPCKDEQIFRNATGGADVEGEESGGGDLTKLPMEKGDNNHNAKGGQEIEGDEEKHGEINGIESSGDSDVLIQNIRDDSLDSMKKSVDETANRTYDRSEDEDGDADLDDNTDPCFSSASEDYGGKIVSERSPRRTSPRDHVSLELDKYGNLQISGSDYDSDGTAEETPDDTNRRNTDRRNASSMSNKVPSVVEPESSQSERSPHGRHYSRSPSPYASLSDDDIGKSHRHSEKCSVSVGCELQEVETCEYSPYKERHGDKPSTHDRRYYDRRRSPIRKEIKQHMKSNHMPHFIDAKGLHEKDMPYRNRPESFLNHSGEFLPDYHSRPAYMKNQYLNARPNFGYEAHWCDGHSINERENYLATKSGKTEYEADACYHNQRRRYAVQDKFEESRKLIPRYSSYAVNKRGTQFSKFSNRGDGERFGRRTEGDDFSPPLDYSDKHRRYMPSNDRDEDRPNHKHDLNIPRDSKRRRGSPLNSPDNLWHVETGNNDRRYMKYQPPQFYSQREPRAPKRGQFQRAAGPMRLSDRYRDHFDRRFNPNTPRDRREMVGPGRGRRKLDSPLNSSDGLWRMETEDNYRTCIGYRPHPRRGLHQRGGGPKFGAGRRHLSSSWKEIHRENDQDRFVRRRQLQQPEVLYSHDELYHVESSLRNKSRDDRIASDRVAEPIDEREVDRRRSILIREEEHCNNQFDGTPKFIHPDSPVQTHPRYRESVDPRLVAVGKKCAVQSSRRTSEAVDVVYSDRYDLMDQHDNQEPKNFEDSDDFNQEKAVVANEEKVNINPNANLDKFSDHEQQNEFLDIEEGQIIEIDEESSKCVIASETALENDNKAVEGLDDEKIREIIAKMEKRRERFKEPITSKIAKDLPELDLENAEGKLERPARKRRWSGR